MKKVLILFGKSNWKKNQPFKNKDYQYSYECFYSLCQKNGIEMYRASYQWYDYNKHLFKYAWVYKGENGNWAKVRNISPDLIYDKTKNHAEAWHKKDLINKKYHFINNLNFTKIIADKFITGTIFPQWSKKSWLIKNKKELKNILHNIKTKKIVIKPSIGSGGEGVQIYDKKEVMAKAIINKENIVQEFIDSSLGVPGISNKMHDLRTIFVNNKLIYAYIREPRGNSFLANLAQGGTLKIVPKSKIPKSIFPITAHISKVFETFNPMIYSVDFMFDKKRKPWIVELNSMPGLYFTADEKTSMVKMYKELIKVFKSEIIK